MNNKSVLINTLLRSCLVFTVLIAGAFSTHSTVQNNERLRSAKEFQGITDQRERSIALFNEASKVLLHPRCVNCHPPDNFPRQGDNPIIHDPPSVRGPKDRGVVAMECTSCHQDRNAVQARIPGAPNWHLAPLEMAWLGKTAAQICAQLKDPKRNGGKTLEEIQHHTAHDELVAWGWNPGADRTPAPGTQQEFGDLIRAWIDTGAECPMEDSAK
jgi:hypothetical protein